MDATLGRRGETGRQWLRRLPELVGECADRWSLRVGAPFAGLTFNFVAPALQTPRRPVVLKLSFVDAEQRAEAEALRWFAGEGAVLTLEEDAERGALLLERLQPGETLAGVAEEKAMSIAAQVMRRLWRAPPETHGFPTIADKALAFPRLRTRFGGGSGPLPESLVDRAERLFADLIASEGPAQLLHGDLHHRNLLSAQRQPWLAIDPAGLVGEPAYEPGALLRNPDPELLRGPNPRRVLARRITQLSEELGFDALRVQDWAIAQAVLSACWHVEDQTEGMDFALACAELLIQIQR